MSSNSWRIFSGSNGAPDADRRSVPSVARRNLLELDPAGYFVPQELADAVDVSIALGQPLLLTGEPGTGKTQLAHHLAWKLFGAGAAPIIFNTKTTSTARDLFYSYDSIRHFRDAQMARAGSEQAQAATADEYIKFQGLGLAILVANPRADTARFLPKEMKELPQQQSVVLIDEVDKAPRDLPNDILNEIERMQFHVNETRMSFSADEQYRPIVILTSNSERMLPDPFLRRCVFHNLEFPKFDELKMIVTQRLGLDSSRPASTTQWIDSAIEQFTRYREQLNRKPSTAELLAWLRLLEQIQSATGVADPTTHAQAKATLGALGKNREDRSRLTSL